MADLPAPAPADTAERLAARRDRLREGLVERDLPAALISNLVNVRYLTGFSGSNGALLVWADGRAPDVFGTDGRYGTQAREQCPGVEVIVERNLLATLTNRAVEAGIATLAVETHTLTVDAYRALLEDGDDERPNFQAPSLGRAVEALRVAKDDTELEHIRTACAISTRALEGLLEAGGFLGRTEKAIALDLEARMYAEGAHGLAFDTIVAAGPNSAEPHHEPGSRVVEPGDFLLFDFGAQAYGYHADCTRTIVVGAEPAAWQREVYDLVRAAQRAGRHALVPGTELKAVDAAARDVITAAGHGEHFTHPLGHGVGLEIHEDPFLGAKAEGKLSGRTPITIEPGVYLPGRGGVRIEDTLVVTDAEPELLTTATKDLLVTN